jgi:hypothetical protein
VAAGPHGLGCPFVDHDRRAESRDAHDVVDRDGADSNGDRGMRMIHVTI